MARIDPSKLTLEERVVAYEFSGRRYDCGTKVGYLEATVDYGLKHPETGREFAAFQFNQHLACGERHVVGHGIVHFVAGVVISTVHEVSAEGWGGLAGIAHVGCMEAAHAQEFGLDRQRHLRLALAQ